MLNNFYDKQNNFQNKLQIFINFRKNNQFIVMNDELCLEDNEDNCEFMRFFTNFIKILDKKYNKENIKNIMIILFTDYVKFIDHVIYYMNTKVVFKDQCLILLSKIENTLKELCGGLVLVIDNYNCKMISDVCKSFLFTLFDFFKIFENLKSTINKQNINTKDSNFIIKTDRTYSF